MVSPFCLVSAVNVGSSGSAERFRDGDGGAAGAVTGSWTARSAMMCQAAVALAFVCVSHSTPGLSQTSRLVEAGTDTILGRLPSDVVGALGPCGLAHALDQ